MTQQYREALSNAKDQLENNFNADEIDMMLDDADFQTEFMLELNEILDGVIEASI